MVLYVDELLAEFIFSEFFIGLFILVIDFVFKLFDESVLLRDFFDRKNIPSFDLEDFDFFILDFDLLSGFLIFEASLFTKVLFSDSLDFSRFFFFEMKICSELIDDHRCFFCFFFVLLIINDDDSIFFFGNINTRKKISIVIAICWHDDDDD